MMTRDPLPPLPVNNMLTIIPLPDNLTLSEEGKRTGPDWVKFMEGLNSGARVEVTQGETDYFLDVLPPISMGETYELSDGTVRRTSFGFAEGYELVKAFWKEGGKYYAQQTKTRNPIRMTHNDVRSIMPIAEVLD